MICSSWPEPFILPLTPTCAMACTLQRDSSCHLHAWSVPFSLTGSLLALQAAFATDIPREYMFVSSASSPEAELTPVPLPACVWFWLYLVQKQKYQQSFMVCSFLSEKLLTWRVGASAGTDFGTYNLLSITTTIFFPSLNWLIPAPSPLPCVGQLLEHASLSFFSHCKGFICRRNSLETS